MRFHLIWFDFSVLKVTKVKLSSLVWEIRHFKGQFLALASPIAKNQKTKDYCKADLKQRVLFFLNNISAGHTSLLQVYRCYWTYVAITILQSHFRSPPHFSLQLVSQKQSEPALLNKTKSYKHQFNCLLTWALSTEWMTACMQTAQTNFITVRKHIKLYNNPTPLEFNQATLVHTRW